MRRALRSLCVTSALLPLLLLARPARAQEDPQPEALREQLLKLEQQQKTLLEQINELQAQAAVKTPQKEDRYQDGIVIARNAEGANVPFLLKLNNNTQIRYLNTLDSDDTFTDHLGVVRELHRRNDITVNRSMFILSGFMFDPRLLYSLTVWTSAGAASIIVAGNIGWQFNKGLTIMGGYTGVPGSRSLVNTFPFFQPTDRSM